MSRLALNLLPGRGLYKGLGLLLALALLQMCYQWLLQDPMDGSKGWWWGCAIGAALFALLDALRLFRGPIPAVSRQLPGNLALGSTAYIRLCFEHRGSGELMLSYIDHYPDAVSCLDPLPARLTLADGAQARIEYRVCPVHRGDAHFGGISLRVRSPWGLWQRQVHIEADQSVKIYPNFMALSGLGFLGHEQRIAHVGAHLTQRRGSGLEFHQLREYQRGDEIRQIDWKATARQQRLISREYQDERDQQILFMLDSGRRMRPLDGELSHFDHALNALLLSAYMALEMGDSVGVFSISGHFGHNRWIRPVKGKQGINRLLNSLYDLQSSAEASDLLQASQSLMQHQQKRALVVIVSNVRDDDADELMMAVKLLSQRHLVMLACLRESFLDQPLAAEASPDDALDYCARQLYREQRGQLIRALKARGALVVDAVPQRMHVALIEEYFALKRAGRI